LAYGGTAAPAVDQARVAVDLSGRWVLDLEDSDPISPLISLFGVDRATQAIAERTVVTQVVRHDGDTLYIDFLSHWRDSTREIPITGVLAEDEDPGGRKSLSRTNWGTGRQSIVSRSQLTLSDKSSAEFVVTRTRPSSDTMLVTSVLTRGGSAPVSVRRVFRLKAS